MRLQKNVDLGDGFIVTVKEATIGQVRNMLRMMAGTASELQNVENNTVPTEQFIEAFDSKLNVLFEQMQHFVVLPAGKSPDDLTITEATTIWETVTELNPRIFSKKNSLLTSMNQVIHELPKL